MSTLATRSFAFTMLVIFLFMTNVGLWSDHSNWLIHELEHSVNVVPMTKTAEYVSLHYPDQSSINSATSSVAVEHEVLHAANHIQLFLGFDLAVSFFALTRSEEFYFNNIKILFIALDAPFRPPRF